MHGFLLGKFLPPTLGHRYLIDFAAGFCDRLTVLACSKAADPIPGLLRHQWLSEAFPAVEVIHHTAELPDAPHGPDDREFWRLWTASIRAHVPTPIDRVFASEPYGAPLAACLDARFIPVDLQRQAVAVSATQVRADPMTHWDLILPQARPWFLRRVCLFGPESTGKSTLAAELARRFGTRHVPEYARQLVDHQGGRCSYDEISEIARGQRAAEAALARQARRVLICDTDLLTTTIWSDCLFGRCPTWITEAAAAQHYDLTFLTDIDCPWVDDGTRYYGAPEQRRAFFERCRADLDRHRRRTLVLSGSYENRLERAAAAIAALIASGRPGPSVS